jgi:uncharacterized coiled-coil protein SlyX
MLASPVIARCPRCAAQAARSARLRHQVTRLQAEVARLQAQLQLLRAQLAQTSANSHKPPSSDLPTRARVKVRELSTRQQVASPGTGELPGRFGPLPQ